MRTATRTAFLVLAMAGVCGAQTARPSRAAVDDDDDVPLHIPRPARPSPSAAPATPPSSPAGGTLLVTQPTAPVEQHAAPFMKLSFRDFAVKSLDNVNSVSLFGAQLDMYPVSRRWVRLAAELEAGGGTATLDTMPVPIRSGIWYAISGASLGFQYPARFTPFVDLRFAAGLLGLSFNEVLGGNHGAFSFMYLAGIDVGFELYMGGRTYLSAAIGWVHPVYRGVDYKLAISNPTAELSYSDYASDAFTFKIGVGL
jgi:hypothetical protein